MASHEHVLVCLAITFGLPPLLGMSSSGFLSGQVLGAEICSVTAAIGRIMMEGCLHTLSLCPFSVGPFPFIGSHSVVIVDTVLRPRDSSWSLLSFLFGVVQ